MKTRFQFGQLAITTRALRALNLHDVRRALKRFTQDNLSCLCPADAEPDRFVLREGERRIAVFQDSSGRTYWIVSEADRSRTTVLLPEDF